MLIHVIIFKVRTFILYLLGFSLKNWYSEKFFLYLIKKKFLFPKSVGFSSYVPRVYAGGSWDLCRIQCTVVYGRQKEAAFCGNEVGVLCELCSIVVLTHATFSSVLTIVSFVQQQILVMTPVLRKLTSYWLIIRWLSALSCRFNWNVCLNAGRALTKLTSFFNKNSTMNA